MSARRLLGALVVIGIVTGSTVACSSSDSPDATTNQEPATAQTAPSAPPSVRPSDVTTCLSDDQWSPIPAQLNVDRAASALGVSTDEVRNGDFGAATCDKAVSTAAMQTSQPPIIRIPGHAPICMAIGVATAAQSAPIPARARKVLVICPGPAGSKS